MILHIPHSRLQSKSDFAEILEVRGGGKVENIKPGVETAVQMYSNGLNLVTFLFTVKHLKFVTYKILR